jgi:hypothetical protein
LSPFPLPLMLLSPLDVSRGFMFPSWGMPRSTPTLPHQVVRMFLLETQTYALVMRSLGDQVFPTVEY